MIVEAFFKFDNLHEWCEDQNQLDSQLGMENPTYDVDFSIGHEGHQEVLMEEIFLKASTPCYESALAIMLSTMLLLLNLKVVRGVSNAFMDKLFSLLQKKLLPNGNKMPTTTYEASKDG